MLRERVARISELDRRGLLDVIGAKVESQTRRRIEDDKAGPQGDAWPDWSDAYAKTRHGGQSLLESGGFLLDSITYAVFLSGDRVEAGSNMIYAATQQYGDKERNIPARDFIGLSNDDGNELEKTVDDFLMRVMP